MLCPLAPTSPNCHPCGQATDTTHTGSRSLHRSRRPRRYPLDRAQLPNPRHNNGQPRRRRSPTLHPRPQPLCLLPHEEVIEAYHKVHSANHAAVSEALQRAPAPKHKHVAWELHQYLSHEAMLTTERETVASHERFVMQFCQMLRRFVRCTDVIEGFAVVVRAPSPTP